MCPKKHKFPHHLKNNYYKNQYCSFEKFKRILKNSTRCKKQANKATNYPNRIVHTKNPTQN